MVRNRNTWRLALGVALAASALTASPAKALQFKDGDLIIILTKNGTDAMYDFGQSIAPGTTKTFTLPTGTNGFPAGSSGALSEGAVANVMGVPHPGLQENDPALGGLVPVGQILFSTTNANPTTLNDTQIFNASSFLQATPMPAASGWLPSLSGFANPIGSTADSLFLPTTRNGSYSSSTGPGNNGQNTVGGSFPSSITTAETIGPNGSLLLNLWFASQGYQSQGGTIPTIINEAAELQFSEAVTGMLKVTTMAVPEPGTLLLLGAGLLGLVSFGSHRKV